MYVRFVSSEVKPMIEVRIRPIDPERDLMDLKVFLDEKDGGRLDLCLKAVADGDAFTLVAEYDGHAVGLAAVHIHPRTDMGWQPQGGTLMWLESGDAYLENIEVKRDLRSKGVGSCLMRKLEYELCGRGKAHIWCHTGEKNVGAQRFYERHGWKYKETLQVPWQPVGRLSRIYCKELKSGEPNKATEAPR